MDEDNIVNEGNNAELEPEQKRKVFIGSLSYQVDEDTFRTYWSQFGTVLYVKLYLNCFDKHKLL